MKRSIITTDGNGNITLPTDIGAGNRPLTRGGILCDIGTDNRHLLMKVHQKTQIVRLLVIILRNMVA